MKKQLLLINFALFLSLVCGQTQPPICDPKTDRHCFDFEEHDVESTFDGVGEVVTRTWCIIILKFLIFVCQLSNLITSLLSIPNRFATAK